MKTAMKLGMLCLFFGLVLALSMGMKGRAIEYKFNMSYIFFNASSSYTTMVDSTQNSLDEVSPNYFALNSAGDLVLTCSVSASFVSDMHSRGISVVPFLTNEWSRSVGKAALRNRDKLSRDLADAISLYDLDGVNIDIENVTADEREAYVDFARLLRELLPDGKSIVVSVAGNPWGISTGWLGSYDYAGLAKYSDYLMVMCYDEHYYGGTAGPISSMSFLDKAMKYAVSVAPKEQIVLGLPFYGRIWGSDGAFPNGYALTNSRIAQYIRNYGGSVYVDPASMSTKAVITVGPDDVKPVVGGQALDAGTYTIWYEGEQSVKAKLQLVDKYGLKGTGSWALGQETNSTWNYYKLWLNNCTFSDVQNSWAKDSILNAYMNNWITGSSADRFSPDEPLTRAQAAVMLVRRLGITPTLDRSYSFDDCVGNWAQAYIETARKYHITSGIGDNLFDPDKPVTRQELAVMIDNAMKLQITNGGSTYSDVTQLTNPWSYHSIQAVSAGGVITGFPDGTYKPTGDVTRAEMTVFLSRMITPLTSSAADSSQEFSGG